MSEKVKVTAEDIRVEEDVLIDFQFAIIDAMHEKGITKGELAARLKVSRARVSQLLSAEANPTLKLVGRALCAVGLKAEYVDHEKAGRQARKREKASFEAMVRQHRHLEAAWGVPPARHANENWFEQREAA